VRICVAIPTYLREQVLVDTVSQVLRQDPPADEVLVVDQSPAHEPEVERFLTERAASGAIRWIRQSPPNLPRARNRALRETTCEVVVFVDDDVVLCEGFVKSHAAAYSDPSVAAVAGRTLQAKPAAGPRRTTWRRAEDYKYFDLEGSERVEGVASFRGCNHSVRRSQMLALGGYDEWYVGWAFREDTDAALRLWKAGRKIVFEPGACLTHLAVPAGGCRLKPADSALPEWMVSFPAHYFAFRHQFPCPAFWVGTFGTNLRRYALRRQIVNHPWLLPWSLWSYFMAWTRAMALSLRRSLSRVVEPGPAPHGRRPASE
jgi:GT2 family glycosyltransferase